jgi:hypothetical protein
MLGANEGEAEGYADIVGAKLGILVGDRRYSWRFGA